MNFPNRRFSSPSIREYQTSKGDSGPRKKRHEPKPILHEPKEFPPSTSCQNQKHCPAKHEKSTKYRSCVRVRDPAPVGRSSGSLQLHSGFATSLRDVALASFALHGFGARCTHLALYWSLRFSKVVDGMLGPERVRYVPAQGRSRSQRLLDPAALVRSRSCSYRDEMSSGLMMSLREVAPG
uniref:Uncharacterized protein n=1 Tax=Brassica oleracea var. oleracea TaxID=109376 RepID=A0A0D3E9M4_BRAOL